MSQDGSTFLYLMLYAFLHSSSNISHMCIVLKQIVTDLIGSDATCFEIQWLIMPVRSYINI